MCPWDFITQLPVSWLPYLWQLRKRSGERPSLTSRKSAEEVLSELYHEATYI